MNRNDIIDRIRTSQWTVFAAMAMAMFLKSVIWHVQLFDEWDIRMHHRLFMAALLALPVLACKKRPWWSLALFVLVSAWMFSCFVFYKAWNTTVTMDDVRNLGNLRGFESSILTDWSWAMLLWLIVPDALYVGVLCWMKPAEKSLWRAMLVGYAVCVLLIPVRQLEYYKPMHKFLSEHNKYSPGFTHFWFNNEPLFNPAYQPWEESLYFFNNRIKVDWETKYVHTYGIIDYGIAMIIYDQYYQSFEREAIGKPVVFSDEDKMLISELYHPENGEFIPQRSLILILVESMESWVVDVKGEDGTWVMPNLHRFMEENKTFYAPRMETMIEQGCSSDGQLMCLTGLAPIAKGITVSVFGEQTYPNFAHYFPSSLTVNPSPGTWRQPVMNPIYGIKMLEESDSVRNDKGIFHRLNSLGLDSVSFVFLITVSTHLPFNMADSVDYQLDYAMPERAARYLKCFHYMDEQLGTFLNRVSESEELRNCDIVITSDHSIMYENHIAELNEYAHKSGKLKAGIEEKQLPLIIYSPVFEESMVYEKQCYQIDVYPTILGLIGCTEPKWKGVGMNLLGDEPRRIKINEARVLSDKLIRSGYFGQH